MAKSTYETKIKPRFKEIREWKAEGDTDLQLAKKLGIGETTFYRHKKNHEEFDAFLLECDQQLGKNIENAYWKRALGMKVTTKKIVETEIFDAKGNPKGKKRVTTINEKELPPHAGLTMFGLINKVGEHWKRNPELSMGEEALNKINKLLMQDANEAEIEDEEVVIDGEVVDD